MERGCKLVLSTICVCIFVVFLYSGMKNSLESISSPNAVVSPTWNSWVLPMKEVRVQEEKKDQTVSTCPSWEPGHIPSPAQMEQMDTEALRDAVHNYGSNAEVVCKTMLRMGNIGDGGWEVCDDQHVKPAKDNCLVYSFGINFDFTFDDMIAKHYGCKVHAFDPSMKMNDTRRSENVWFYHLGAYGEKTLLKKKWPVDTLSNIRQKLGHSQSHVDVLKMDIEHSEWSTLDKAMTDGGLDNISQLLLEIHGTLDADRNTLVARLKTLANVRSLGFRIFYAHKNPACKENNPKKTPTKVNCYEIHLLRIPSCAKT